MLHTMAERFNAWARRMLAVELSVARVVRFVEQGERMQDRVNVRVAARLAALEDRLPPLP